MKSLTLIASSVLQTVYVVGLVVVVVSLLRADLSSQYASGDPRVLAGFISSQAVTLLLVIIAGLIGVLLMTVVVRGDRQPPRWFVDLSALFAIAWIVLVPIGTVIGALMLRWRSRLRSSESAF